MKEQQQQQRAEQNFLDGMHGSAYASVQYISKLYCINVNNTVLRLLEPPWDWDRSKIGSYNRGALLPEEVQWAPLNPGTSGLQKCPY